MTAAIKKFAAELHEIGGLGRLGDDESLLSDGVEERGYCADRLRFTSGNNEKLSVGRRLGAAEHRSSNEPLPGCGVSGREPFGQRDANRAGRDMDCAFAKVCEHALVAIHHTFDGVVIRQHGEDGLAATSVRDLGGRPGAHMDQFLVLARRPIVDGHVVPGLDQVSRHAAAMFPSPMKPTFMFFSFSM